MPYKISGNVEEESRILVIKETDYSIESNTVETGNYEIDSLENSNKIILVRNTSTGETKGYGGVHPFYYQGTREETFIVNHSGDDGWWRQDGGTNFSNTGTMYVSISSNYWGWLRLNNVTVPQGSLINNATVRLTAWNGQLNTHEFIFRVILQDNPSRPSSWSDIRSRPRSSGITHFGIAGTGGGDHCYYEITSLIQQIVNRPGWLSGNSILIVIQPVFKGLQWCTMDYNYNGANDYGRITINYDPA